MNFESNQTHSLLTDELMERNKKPSYNKVALLMGIGLLGVVAIGCSMNSFSASEPAALSLQYDSGSLVIGSVINIIIYGSGRYLVKYDNTEIWTKYETDATWWTEDSQFKVVPGLAGGTSVSFESVHLPGMYIWDDDTYSFMEDTSVTPGLEG